MNYPGLVYLLMFLLTISVHAESPQANSSNSHIAQKLLSKAEAARKHYVNDLTKIAWEYFKTDKGPVWNVLDPGLNALFAEIAKHPAPENTDSPASRKMLIGEWQSPRHDYAFYEDGTWRMLPLDACTTHGRWWIEGNQYWGDLGMNKKSDTIILLNRQFFVFGKAPIPFFMRRFSK